MPRRALQTWQIMVRSWVSRRICCLFTEAHFPEPIADIRGSQELFDPAHRPRLNLAERTYERLRRGIDIGR